MLCLGWLVYLSATSTDLLSGTSDPEDEDEQTGRQQLPNEQDGTEGEVTTVAEVGLQIGLKQTPDTVHL